MKQMSTGTGLVVLSGTILASVFLSSPRTATTAFASAQQAQPGERSVGRKADAAAPVAMGGACESQIWFNTQPREFVESCDPYTGGFRFGDISWSDVNSDGKVESFSHNEGQLVVSGSNGVGHDGMLTLHNVFPTSSGAKLKLIDILDLPTSFGDYFVTEYGVSEAQFGATGWTDCDGDNDLDLVIGVRGRHLDNSSFSFVGWLENTGFQHTASLEGDLNGDGQIDNADVGVLLLHFDA
jgi:hypothetical protein